MNKKISLGAAIAFALIVAAAVFSVTMVYSQKQFNTTMSALNEREVMYKKLSEVVQQVSSKYYGYASVNADELQDHIAAGYLSGIGDPNATYYTPAEYAKLQRRLAGTSMVGIGAEFMINSDGYLIITTVYPDSPAWQRELEVGDLVTQVNDITVDIDNNQEQLHEISGPEGSEITLTIRKGGKDSVVVMKRREVDLPTVFSSYLPGGVGYIRISSFDKNTSNQFSSEYKRLENKGAVALVLDLRDNKSETLESASRILDRIVPSGPIVRVMGKDGTIEDVEFSDTTELNIPIVTIVNKETSGAAELFALVLRDYKKANIVGNTTAGVAESTEIIKLSDGSAIEITVAMYVSPKGKTYQDVGAKPDFEVALPSGVTNWADLEIENDPQFLKAVELVSTVLRSEGRFDEDEVEQAALDNEAAEAEEESIEVVDESSVSEADSSISEGDEEDSSSTEKEASSSGDKSTSTSGSN